MPRYMDRNRWAARKRAEKELNAAHQGPQEHERIGHLMGFQDSGDPVIRDHQVVGWMHPSSSTVKGRDHVCISCKPVRPLGFVAVHRNQLAATLPCLTCGTVLELIDVSEKK